VDTELEVLGELLVEFLVVFLVFSNFGEHFEALLDNVLLDNLKNFVLLKGLSRDVKWEIVGIDNTLNE
jgi:hypothetical protein